MTDINNNDIPDEAVVPEEKEIELLDGLNDENKPAFKVNIIDVDWPKKGGVTDFKFKYKGIKGTLFVPYPGIFEPINGQDQMFELGNGKANKIRLRPKDQVEAMGYDVSGNWTFPYAIYDEEKETFAIGFSPPKMKLGP